MVNQRLRNALIAAELTQADLGEKVGVDAKSVERWITQDRIPHATTRARVSHLLRLDETYFWPALLGTQASKTATESELVQIWPTRNTVPGDVWRALFDQAKANIDVLVYGGGFLIEAYDLVEVLRRKSDDGVHTRILVGDPRCGAVRQRGEEEGLPSLGERCQATLDYLASTTDWDGVQIRTHQTVLYASQYRFDDAVLVNNHTYGSWAARSPVMHLRRVPGGQLFDYYGHAFNRVWETGRAVA